MSTWSCRSSSRWLSTIGACPCAALGAGGRSWRRRSRARRSGRACMRPQPTSRPSIRCEEAVVHQGAPPRAASVVHAMMAGHRPQVWLSDRYSAQQGHADAQQTCLAHLARDVAYAREASEDDVPWELELWLGSVFD